MTVTWVRDHQGFEPQSIIIKACLEAELLTERWVNATPHPHNVSLRKQKKNCIQWHAYIYATHMNCFKLRQKRVLAMKLRLEGKLLLEISVGMRILPILWCKQAHSSLFDMPKGRHIERWLKHYYKLDIILTCALNCSVLERICVYFKALEMEL